MVLKLLSCSKYVERMMGFYVRLPGQTLLSVASVKQKGHGEVRSSINEASSLNDISWTRANNNNKAIERPKRGKNEPSKAISLPFKKNKNN